MEARRDDRKDPEAPDQQDDQQQGISNRPRADEAREQAQLPPRGEKKDGGKKDGERKEDG
jgi:hypothetical protein